jgi:hypothetical protein
MGPSRTPGQAGFRCAAILVALFAGPGCGRSLSEAPEAGRVPEVPAGAVLLVGDLALLATDVRPLEADILALYPEYSPTHARRLALTNEFLPRLALRSRDPQSWARAREACERAADLDESARGHEGGFHALGVGLWSLARHLPEGRWSAPLELAGRWVRVRLDEKSSHPDPRQEILRLSLVEFPLYAPEAMRERTESALDEAVLVLCDPAFAEAVPEAWKHRMHAAP